MTSTSRTTFLTTVFALLPALAMPSFGQTIDFATFADFSLDEESAWIGPVNAASGEDVDGGFDTIARHGTWDSGGVQFANRYNLTWGSWSGFAASNRTETAVAGFTSGTSAYPGSGAGDDNYAVAFGYVDGLDRSDVDALAALPHFELPSTSQPSSVKISNTTYGALSMLDGDDFAKKFGGSSGNDPDYLLMTIYGTQNGSVLDNSVEFYLADFRSDDQAEDYVLDSWSTIDLAPLADADHLHFNLQSTDVGDFGMNTPASFALDDLVLVSVGALAGDINGDGSVTELDVDAVCGSVATGETDITFDVNGDGLVSNADVAWLLESTGRLPGDADFDGQVQFGDFLRLSLSFGNEAAWSGGDFDCDGEAQFSDFLVLSENFGSSVSQTSSVPEPNAIWLVGVALPALLIRRARA